MGAVGNCIKNGGYFRDEFKTDGSIFRAFIRKLVTKLDADTKSKYPGTKPWILLVSTKLIDSNSYFMQGQPPLPQIA